MEHDLEAGRAVGRLEGAWDGDTEEEGPGKDGRDMKTRCWQRDRSHRVLRLRLLDSWGDCLGSSALTTQHNGEGL